MAYSLAYQCYNRVFLSISEYIPPLQTVTKFSRGQNTDAVISQTALGLKANDYPFNTPQSFHQKLC